MNISIRFIKEVSYLKALTEWQSSVHDFILRLKRKLQLSRIEAKEKRLNVLVADDSKHDENKDTFYERCRTEIPQMFKKISHRSSEFISSVETLNHH